MPSAPTGFAAHGKRTARHRLQVEVRQYRTYSTLAPSAFRTAAQHQSCRRSPVVVRSEVQRNESFRIVHLSRRARQLEALCTCSRGPNHLAIPRLAQGVTACACLCGLAGPGRISGSVTVQINSLARGSGVSGSCALRLVSVRPWPWLWAALSHIGA
eukprot:12335304-Alexandrium_andersonii.AAC.1